MVSWAFVCVCVCVFVCVCDWMFEDPLTASLQEWDKYGIVQQLS